MNQFHIGDSTEYILAEYAKTGRSACKKCKDKIQDKSVRIGILLDDDHFGGCNWYHFDCFTLKPRHKVLLNEEDLSKKIHSIDTLNKKDKQKVIVLLMQELNRLNGGKNNKSTKKQSKSQVKTHEAEKPKSKSKSKPKSKAKLQVVKNQGKPKTSHTPKVPSPRKTRGKSMPKPIQTKSVDAKSKKAQKKVVQKKINAVQKKKQKKVAVPKSFFTASQQAQFKQLRNDYLKLTAVQLKEILQANNQVKTGTKDQLAERCADGKQLGKTPICGNCFGGKLRFNRKTATYTCPGYMQDETFKNCNAKFTFDEIKREAWREP